MKAKKIPLLWAPLADYTLSCLKELSKKDIEIYLIYQPGDQDAPYAMFDLSFCKVAHAYDKTRKKEFFNFCLNLSPDFTIMSSWNYSFYMYISKICKRNGTYVISTFDGQWKGTLKQRLGVLSSKFFLKPSVDNFFVPGDRQAILARKLGYKNPFLGYYCANTRLFNRVSTKENNFIFVGRLISIKGVEYLIKAYKKYRSSVTNPWGLIICGKGVLQPNCEKEPGVELHGFIQPSDLPKIFSKAKCLILPSFIEPWGLVVHEAVLAGLTVISSFAAGASTIFVRDGQNGYIINPDEISLLLAMKLISKVDNKKFDEMVSISKTLGLLWATDKWADYVYDQILMTPKNIPSF